MAKATLLLPGSARFAGLTLAEPLARALGRADRIEQGVAGHKAQLLRHFELLPRSWPAAALSRKADADDAAQAAWLRADPAWVRPDMTGARLFAHGGGLQLTRADVDALLPALRPLFGDGGFLIDAPVPSRWYVQLPREARLPAFAEPDDALGADLFEHLVDTGDGSSQARRWRALLSEAQVVLHNHPWNGQRAAAGKPPVNSLWFWGGGVLPDHVGGDHASVQTDDALLRGLAELAGAAVDKTALQFPPLAETGNALFDLRNALDPTATIRNWLLPAAAAVATRRLERLRLDFADGSGLLLTHGQRWRLWRRPLRQLASVAPGGPSP